MENNILFFFNSRPLLEIFWKFCKISQNIQRGDPWDFFIIGDFFEILKIFPKYPKGGPLEFFFGGTPPNKKFFNAFLDELRIQKKKKRGTGFTPPPLWKFPYFFFEPFPKCIFFNSCFFFQFLVDDCGERRFIYCSFISYWYWGLVWPEITGTLMDYYADITNTATTADM